MAYVGMFLVTWAIAQIAIVLVQYPGVLGGAQLDSDGYFRLMRVASLLDGAGWYDGSISVSNWPFGQDLHWTRPLDVLIILLALPWALALPMDTALLISGGLVSPLLHAVLCLAGIWVIGPLVTGSVRLLASAALLAHPGVMAYGTAGRADHHALVLLLSSLAIGAWIRALMAPDQGRWGVWAGLAAAAAVWVSPEALVPVAAIFASGGVAWVVHGSVLARPNLRFSLALVMGLCVALLLERSPGNWLVSEYDRISAAHVFMGLLAFGFWFTATALSSRFNDVRSRGLLAGVGGVLTFGLLYTSHPGFFLGPGAAMDPWLRDFAFGSIAELQPIVGSSWEDIGRSIVIFGLVPPVLWFAGNAALRGRTESRRLGWYPVLAGLLLFVPMAAAQSRFVGYAGVVVALAATGLLGALLQRADRRHERGSRLRAVRVGTMFAVLIGPLVVGSTVEALGSGEEEPGATAESESCEVEDAIDILRRAGDADGEAHVVAVSPNIGPTLAFEAGVRIIAGPYHRSPEGLRDLFQFFQTADMDEAEDLARSRQVTIVLICPPTDRGHLGGGPPGSLYSRMADGGATPPWLQRTTMLDLDGGAFMAYRVLNAEGVEGDGR